MQGSDLVRQWILGVQFINLQVLVNVADALQRNPTHSVYLIDAHHSTFRVNHGDPLTFFAKV